MSRVLEGVRIIQADLNDPDHQTAVFELTCAYARDPMGYGKDLPENVQRELIERLRAHPTTLILLAFDGNRPIGIATCFLGFSTFAARQLVNVHDLHVLSQWQRRGVARRLLEAVEAKARQLDCCKLTLEVNEENHAAAALYRGFGFESGARHSDQARMLFLNKPI
jgi:GNAT superfamily N-acetyltransferase